VKTTSVGRRFIHGSSHHPPSTFKSIIFGEAIRLRRLNERKEDYLTSLNRLQNKAKKSKFPVNITNDMITLVSKWENRLHPPNPSDKNNYSVWPTSFPNLLRLTKKEKTLNNEAMITYKRPITVGQLLTNYRSLAHSEASNQHQRGYSGHCALCGKFGKHDANMVPKVTALHSKGKLFPLKHVLTCANYGIYVAACKLCGEQYDGQTSNKFSKCWNSHRSSWDTFNLSNDQEQVPLLHHVVQEHKIENKPKISECFIVTFVEQPSYEYVDICED